MGGPGLKTDYVDREQGYLCGGRECTTGDLHGFSPSDRVIVPNTNLKSFERLEVKNSEFPRGWIKGC